MSAASRKSYGMPRGVRAAPSMGSWIARTCREPSAPSTSRPRMRPVRAPLPDHDPATGTLLHEQPVRDRSGDHPGGTSLTFKGQAAPSEQARDIRRLYLRLFDRLPDSDETSSGIGYLQAPDPDKNVPLVAPACLAVWLRRLSIRRQRAWLASRPLRTSSTGNTSPKPRFPQPEADWVCQPARRRRASRPRCRTRDDPTLDCPR